MSLSILIRKLFQKIILNNGIICLETIYAHERIVHYMQTTKLVEDSSSVTAGLNTFLKNVGKQGNVSEERVIQFMTEITNYSRCLSYIGEFYV